MHYLPLLLTAGIATGASAQIVAPNSNSDHPSALCNKTFADANATGIFSFNPGVVQGPQVGQPDNQGNLALDAQWGMTVFDNIGASNATAEVSGWYNTNGANYSDDGSLWYDVCVFTTKTLTLNTYNRAVNDKGDCLETFDQPCVQALQDQAQGFIAGLVGNPTPNPGSNLTQGSLDRVCYDVGTMMTDNFPKECNKFYNGSATVYGSAMTSHNDSWLYDGCNIHDDENNGTFHYVTGNSIFTSTYSEEVQKIIYSNLTQIVIPVMAVFLPIADIYATRRITDVNAVLSCPHINHINEGSLQPYAPPSPTPIGGSSSLSGGTIAGIVVGVIAGLAIVLGALWFFWFRKRRASKKGQRGFDANNPPPTYSADVKIPHQAPYANEQVPLTELGGQDNQVRPELPTQKSGLRVELAGDSTMYNDAPAELPASTKHM